MNLESSFSQIRREYLIAGIATFLLFVSANIFAQGLSSDKSNADKRTEFSYKQRHSKASNNTLYADGIKIKRDLSILKEAQEQRILEEGEIPSEDIYGGVWSSARVNAYSGLENIPDTFTVDLSNFTMPSMGYVTSNFGPRRRRIHYGIDLKVQVGDTIYAAFDGKVRMCKFERRGYGNYVVLRHQNGLETVYGHLSKFLVSDDDVVKTGDPIALGGNTGRSTGSHLHFEFRFLGKPINPINIVDFDNKVCHKDTYKITSATFDYPKTRQALAKQRWASTKKSGTKNKYTNGSVSYHRIKNGDTLGQIARRYGTSVSKLCKLNNITSKAMLKAGKSIRVS